MEKPTTLLAKKYRNAFKDSPALISEINSIANDEKVVKPPKTPTINRSLTVEDAEFN